jgi:hypothetical protein
MYSSGYDGHISIWRTDTESALPILGAKLNVRDKVDILLVNYTHASVICAFLTPNVYCLRFYKIYLQNIEGNPPTYLVLLKTITLFHPITAKIFHRTTYNIL